jgi:hypothetical protein
VANTIFSCFPPSGSDRSIHDILLNALVPYKRLQVTPLEVLIGAADLIRQDTGTGFHLLLVMHSDPRLDKLLMFISTVHTCSEEAFRKGNVFN